MLALVIVTAIASVVSALFYRWGGLSKEEAAQNWPWVPQWLINSKTRDVGCSLLTVGWMLLFYPTVDWWCYLVAFGISWGMLTTYWDFLFGYDNFYAHGFGVALALLPFAILTGMWIGFAIRLVVLSLAMGIWSQQTGNADAEELGRGAVIVLSLPLALV